jgi:hypothetical protein
MTPLVVVFFADCSCLALDHCLGRLGHPGLGIGPGHLDHPGHPEIHHGIELKHQIE